MNKLIIRLTLVLILIAGLTLFNTFPVLASGDNWLSGWAHRVKITIDHTKIAASLADFPVLVHLSSSSGISSVDVSYIFNNLGDNSKKIAVTTSDGTTQCYAEIEKWDSVSKQAYIWVKVPNISSTADTDLYLYYDSSHADNTAMIGNTGSTPAMNVWGSNFKDVLHLSESGNNTAGEYKDSTSNHHDGQGGDAASAPNGPASVPLKQAGRLGDGQYFDGSNDYITVPDSNDFSQPTTGYLTISWWFKPTVLNFPSDSGASEHYINMLGKGGYPNGWEYTFTLGGLVSSDKKQEVAFYVSNPSGDIQCGEGVYRSSSNGGNNQNFEPYNTGDWIYVTGRLDNNYVYVTGYYPDGYSYTSPQSTWNNYPNYPDNSITPANTWSPFSIGTIPTQGQMFEGVIDEVRISNSFRSDAWIKASYYSESDKLLIFEANQASSTTTVTSSANPSVHGQSVTFTATVSAAAPSAGIPTGNVTFKNVTTNTILGTVTLNASGQATYTTSAFSLGSYSISAVYGGDYYFMASTGTLTQKVNKASSTTTVTSSANNPSVYGQLVTFTATVSATAPSAATPTATVTFKDVTTNTTLRMLYLTSGRATYTTFLLSSGSHSISVVYGGDYYFMASTGTLIQTVN